MTIEQLSLDLAKRLREMEATTEAIAAELAQLKHAYQAALAEIERLKK